MSRSYVAAAGLDLVDTITEAQVEARLTVSQCIELCDISERTWYRWLKDGAPTWAIRLVMSQAPNLDRFGWKDWEITGGCLYFKQLSYRYYWTPTKLILPLWGITSASAPWESDADNLSSLDTARKARIAPENSENRTKTPESPDIHNLG